VSKPFRTQLAQHETDSATVTIPAPFSTYDPTDIGNAGIYSAGPDPGLTCYFYK